MALPAVGDAAYPTPDEIRDQMLADIAFAYARRGITANVLPGSDHFIRCKVIAGRISIALANNKIGLANVSPLTATGQALLDLAGVFGVTPRLASAASGYVTITCSGTVAIPAGFQCVSPDGHTYATTGAVTVTTGAAVLVQATTSGATTNQNTGTVVTWSSAAIGNLKQTAIVAAPGIVGGVDADTDEVIRARLIRKLSAPGIGGNVAQVIEWAEESTAAVDRAYVYAAARGAGSYDVALTRAGPDKTLPAGIVAQVAAYIAGKMPGHADLNVTTVAPEGVDIILDTSLPLPITAGGSGGGWRDALPWPSSADAVGLAKVTGVAGNVITVNSTSADAPAAGKHFGIWNPVFATMAEFTIQSVAGGSGAYAITIDPSQSSSTAFVANGMYCSAGAIGLKTYAADFAAQIQALGPGEKSTNVDILARGHRQPAPDLVNPSNLTILQLAGMTSLHPEILNLNYAARYATGTSTPLTAPDVPAALADPPRNLSLQNLAFRKA